MNSFRASILSGGVGWASSDALLGNKKPSRGSGDSLEGIAVGREVSRTADHRHDDRHRLTGETTDILVKGVTRTVDLINLSGGGAMIATDIPLTLWQRVDLVLGENGTVECAVRWIRGDRIGLEFAHETQVLGDPATRDAMLLEVIRRSFPDIVQRDSDPAPFEVPAQPDAMPNATRRSTARHPLIWSGTVHFNHDSTAVRVRNISPSGALVESPLHFPTGVELYLDLGAAGSLFATVSWARGDQIGLRFAAPFDIAQLAKSRPDLAPRHWANPDYLRLDQAKSSPWAEQWGRLSIDELKTSLEGYLKH